MRFYSSENWVELGKWVHDARLRAGITDMKVWAEKVERSVRQVQGLERGEPVGEKTLVNVAKALEVELSVLIDILSGRKDDTVQASAASPKVRDVLAEIERLQNAVKEINATLAALRSDVEPDDQ